ncbi:MAG: helix-turn-helix transcriptional regulator [Campylobacteraceae bacterium]|jgi:MerR family transcriptional regulator/heat shock protein HspR|nr:helix-turn-helix transcriptional regulator [Campylobacteraceae bacterium]
MHDYKEPVYLISVVAKVLEIHPQTLRQYEREGLIIPSRTDGKMRLYSQMDIDRIKLILRLTRELGVNLAGVDVVLQLKEKMDELENTIDELRVELSNATQKGSSIAPNKNLVKRKKTYDVIIFGE